MQLFNSYYANVHSLFNTVEKIDLMRIKLIRVLGGNAFLMLSHYANAW